MPCHSSFLHRQVVMSSQITHGKIPNLHLLAHIQGTLICFVFINRAILAAYPAHEHYVLATHPSLGDNPVPPSTYFRHLHHSPNTVLINSLHVSPILSKQSQYYLIHST